MTNQVVGNSGSRAKAGGGPLAWGLGIAGLAVSYLLLTTMRRREPMSESRSDVKSEVPLVAIANMTSGTLQDKPTPAKTTQKTPTLSGFVEDNEKLVGVLGVFTAISVFVSGLSVHWLGYLLSFLFMILTVILWLELWTRFPSGSGDWKITAFEDILTLAVLALVAYVLVDFRDLWKYALTLLIYSIALGVFSSAVKKYDVFNRLFHSLPGERRWLRYLIGYAVALVGLYLALALARYIAPPLNRLLDGINTLLTQ